MRLLAIDTSNQTLAIAVSDDNKLLGMYTTTVKKNHSLTLMPAISQLMKEIELLPKQLDRIVVAQGPGSYTGLRIGVTTAKTLAYTLQKELVGISSLQVLAANCLITERVIVPLFDARRKNVYSGAYQWAAGELQPLLPDRHIALSEWLEQLKGFSNVYFVGEDSEKFREQIKSTLPEAQLNTVPQWQVPNGLVLTQLGRKAKPVAQVHHFLPNYLKRVEAEENWLKTHQSGAENYVEKI